MLAVTNLLYERRLLFSQDARTTHSSAPQATVSHATSSVTEYWTVRTGATKWMFAVRAQSMSIILIFIRT